MSMNKNLLVTGFTLALLIVVSHRATAIEERIGVMCTSLEMCAPICWQRGYTGGYCYPENVGGNLSCVCTKPYPPVQSMTVAPVEKQLVGNGDAGGMGMGN